MEVNVNNEYYISSTTIAVLPHYHHRFQTKIIDAEDTYYAEECPFEVINRSCMKYGADYTGRRNAAVYHTNYKQKTPLLISESLRLVAIPSHSPDHTDCTWIMFHQIANINALDQETCEVMCNYFTDLKLNISAQTMRTQVQKAAVIYSIFCTDQKIGFSFMVDGRRPVKRK
ncbi:competence protein ComK [Bacillus sp. FJAT-45066]|uniref:competence protein ComK n=1 Tax=Bacillus sp. FJAT-45066 TaxID=2011010 RepID=UPI000BB79B1F|nr:competence protein ComK [Bacillus sp. FJAT-45066]